MSELEERHSTHVRQTHSSKNCESKNRSRRSVLPEGGSAAAGPAFAII